MERGRDSARPERAATEAHSAWREEIRRRYGVQMAGGCGPSSAADESDASLREVIPQSFCLYPFLNLTVDPNGRARPCCKFLPEREPGAHWSQPEPTLADASLQELYDQENLRRLRASFLRGERPEGCRQCWNEEAAGILSMRLALEQGGRAFPWKTLHRDLRRRSPAMLDLKLTSICNSTCRICGPSLSSKWIRDAKQLGMFDIERNLDVYLGNARKKLTVDSRNLEIFSDWLPKVTVLEFYGGEPLLQEEHLELLDLCIREGHARHISLFVNTNTTLFDRELCERWRHFKYVNLSFSVDDVGSRLEYERPPARWEEIRSNVEDYLLYARNNRISIDFEHYVTVSVFNVLHLADLIRFNGRHWNLPMVFNMVHMPAPYSIVNLPDAAKQAVERRIDACLEATRDLEYLLRPGALRSIVEFMHGRAGDPAQLRAFFDHTRRLDRVRGERFEEVFPELHALLRGGDLAADRAAPDAPPPEADPRDEAASRGALLEALALQRRGTARLARGDREGALADFSRAIEIDGASGETALRRAVLRRQQCCEDEALRDLDEVLRLDPRCVRARLERGILYRRRGDLERAAVDLEQALELDPEGAWGWLELGFVQRLRGEQERAEALHERGIDLMAADLTDALRVFRGALLHGEDAPRYYVDRARLWRRLGRDEAALDDLGRAIELDPELYWVWLERARLWRARGDQSAALHDYEQAALRAPVPASSAGRVIRLERDALRAPAGPAALDA